MKIEITPKVILRGIKEYILITVGLLLYCFAWIGIVQPAEMVGGGVAGMSMLVYYVTGGAEGGIPMVYSMLFINGLLLVLATILIGFKFSTKTIYAVVAMSLGMGVMQSILPPNILGLADDRLLSAVLAGVMIGMGVALCFSQGGSTGGTDIIAMIINKYRSVSYGRVIMIVDFLTIGASYFINDDITAVIYSFIVVGATGYTLDALLAGNRQSSQLLIMSKKYDEIAAQIVNEAKRGVTMLNAEGYYSKQAMKVVMVVTRKSETSIIYRIVKDIDPEAFITVGSVMGVYGQGFDKLKAKGKKK